MTAVFSEKEKKEAFAEKKKLLTLWFVLLGIYLIAIAVMVTINCVLIYTQRSRAVYIPFTVTSILLSCVFWSGTVFFFSIKYKLTSRYCRMLTGMKEGLKDRGFGTMVEIDPTVTEKDGVFFYSLVLDCPPMKRGDITVRKILVERTHSLPDFKPGDKIKFITHANILMAYELDMDEVFDSLNSAESKAAQINKVTTGVLADDAAKDAKKDGE